MPKPHSNPFRAFLKQQLFALLLDLFREYLDTHEQARRWTFEHCPHCGQPFAFPDALYCAFCGMLLRATEPALCAVQFPQFPTTDPIYVAGEFARIHHREASPDIGPHTQITRAISKIHLQPQPQAQAKELPTK